MSERLEALVRRATEALADAVLALAAREREAVRLTAERDEIKAAFDGLMQAHKAERERLEGRIAQLEARHDGETGQAAGEAAGRPQGSSGGE